MERYSTRQSVCFCGVLPSINRAWATVDNALFLWRLDRPDDVPVEYSGEEQAIVAVGLAKPKRGVFLKTIDAVLVVATTVEVVLVGCAFGDGAEGTTYDDPLTLHPLNYSCTTDDVVAKDIASTEDGRIFFAGDDESLYEIEYSATDTWRQRRCRKVCHHSALPRMLPSILRLRAPDPLRQVLVDEHRCALYTRSEAGVVMVFDLGPRCADAPRKVAEVRDVAAASQMARGGGGLFNQYGGYGGGYGGGSSSGYGVGGGGYGGGGSYGAQSNAAAKDGQSQAQKGRRLAHISVVSPSESSVVTLVAVCADGRRVYFTTLPAEGRALGYGGSGSGYNSQNQVGGSMNKERRVVPPACRLAVVQSREPLPQGSAQRGMSSAQALRATTTVRPLEVEAAFYGDGLMLLCDATERDEDARLFMASRDLALPPHMQLDANAGLVGSPGINPGSAINPNLNLNPAPTNNPYGTPGNNPYGTPGRSTGGVSGQMGSPGINPQSSGAYQGVGAGAQSGAAIRSLREIVTPQPLQGRAASAVGSVGEIPPPIGVQRDLDPPYPVGAPRELTTQPRPLRSELATQHLGAPRRKFVVVTNAGIVTVEKSRPLDALSKILVSDAPEPLVNFFKSYGQAEAATMCLAIAVGASESGGGGSKNSISSIEGNPNDGSRLTPGGGVGTPGTPGGHAVFGAGSPRVPRPSSAPRKVPLAPPAGTSRVTAPPTWRIGPGARSRTRGSRANRAWTRTSTPLAWTREPAGSLTWAAPSSSRSSTIPACIARCTLTPLGCSRRRGSARSGCPSMLPTSTASGRAPRGPRPTAKTHTRAPRPTAACRGVHGVNPGGIHPSSKPLRDVINAGAADGGGVTGAAAAAAGWLGGILRPNHPTGAPVACTIPPDVLGSLERRLAPLENFPRPTTTACRAVRQVTNGRPELWHVTAREATQTTRRTRGRVASRGTEHRGAPRFGPTNPRSVRSSPRRRRGGLW